MENLKSKRSQAIYRGSEWRKWDLQLHCPDDVLNNQFSGKTSSEKWGNYVAKIEQTNLEGMGLTNYFCIDGYEKILNYKKKGQLNNIKIILPNIEFRLSQPNRRGEYINLHVIFSDTISINKIKDFLARLPIISTDPERRSFFCTKNDLQQIGYDKALVELGELSKKLKENFVHRKDYIIVGVARGYGSFRPSPSEGRGASLAIEIDKMSDFFFGKSGDTGHFLKTTRYIGAIPKPVVQTSDAHELKEIGSQFTWIKANPTFEGLKQIIYEPRERVKIQTANPEPIKSIYSIDSISIRDSVVNKNLSIEETQIPLNRNLVAVIGGKGSGKTALLDLLANCYPQKINPLNRNSFVRRIFTDAKDLNTKITFLNAEDFSKKLVEEKFVIESDIEYIPQGQIENKIGDTKEFHKFLQNLIFESNKIKKSVVLSEYNEIKQNIEDINTKIEQLNQEIYITEMKTQKKKLENLDRELKLKNTERENIKNKVVTLRKGFTQEKLEEIQKISKKLSNFQDTREKILNLRRLIQEVREKFATLDDINESLERINGLVKVLSLNLKEIELFDYRDVENKLETIEKNGNKKLLQVNKYIKSIQEQIGKLRENKKVYTVLLNRLYSVNTEIKQLKERQKLIKGFKKLLLKKEGDRQGLYKNLFQNYINLQEKYKEIIKAFSKDTNDILAGVDFKASLVFNFNEFAEKGEDVLDLRTIRESKTQKVSLLETDYFKEIIDVLKRLVDLDDKNKEKIIDDLIEKVKTRISEFIQIKKSTRTNEDLYEWLFGDYLSLNTEVYFNNIPREKLSLGQKCTVLLKVYLAQGDNSILIDQPDDNLDNEFIMNELVKAIRKAKANRQIIIASNNANVVINSDAEQIIVANYKDNEISYTAGAIENPTIRGKAIHILEGGKEAFENREKKYGFKHI